MKYTPPERITYLRRGRVKRASGQFMHAGANGMVKVTPSHPGWAAIWLTADEIEAGKEKPPLKPRHKPEAPATAPKRTRQPKPTPPPAWAQMVARVRTYEIDHTPNSYPHVSMSFLSDLADELEKAHARLSEFLPLGSL